MAIRRTAVRAARALHLIPPRPCREDILRLAPKHAVCAEIGVFRGEFSRHIVQITRPAELHLIDGWWTLYGEQYPDWGDYTDHGNLSTRQAHAETVAAAPSATVQVGDALVILATFPDHHFDWAYLDTSHAYEQTVRELAILARKIKPAGLLLGDDWHDDPTHMHAGVTKAVCEAEARGEWTIQVAGDAFMQWAARPRRLGHADGEASSQRRQFATGSR